MATYTLGQYEELCKAIATGAQQVMYGNKMVIYKSTEDMLRVKALMEKELGIGQELQGTKKGNRRYAQFSKGL